MQPITTHDRRRARHLAAVAALLGASALAACVEDGDDLGTAELGLGQVCVSVTEGVAGGVVDDTYVSGLLPNRNFDSSPFALSVRPGARPAITLVRARLDRIPANARVESASLTLFTTPVRWFPLEVVAHRITAPWSEGAVTFASFHSAFDAAGVAGIQRDSSGPYAFDLATLVSGWLRGQIANQGVAITVSNNIGVFADEHAITTAAQPTLTVCYTTCTDGARNGDETGVDCGGATCGACVVDADGDGAASTVDCDDHDATVRPGAAERCNLVDDDCDGRVDQGNPDAGAACSAGAGVGTMQCVAGALTCIATAERCDGLDNDGDGVIDDGNPGGFVDCSHYISFNVNDPTEIGGLFYGYTSCAGGDVECLPITELEACDGIDNDHDGLIDEAGVLCRDADGDGSGSPLDQVPGCGPVPGYSTSCGDCDDSAPEINPDGFLEWCDSPRIYADNNCDGIFDRNRDACV